MAVKGERSQAVLVSDSLKGLDLVRVTSELVEAWEERVGDAVFRGGPRISDRLLRWDPDQREGVWNVPKETELPG